MCIHGSQCTAHDCAPSPESRGNGASIQRQRLLPAGFALTTALLQGAKTQLTEPTGTTQASPVPGLQRSVFRIGAVPQRRARQAAA